MWIWGGAPAGLLHKWLHCILRKENANYNHTFSSVGLSSRNGPFLSLDARRKCRLTTGPLVTCASPGTVTWHHVSVPTT